MDLKHIEDVKSRFVAKDTVNTPAYNHYIDVVDLVCDRYADAFDIVPRSKANAAEGKNRGINLRRESWQPFGIHVKNDSFKLYIDKVFHGRIEGLDLIQDGEKSWYEEVDSIEDVFSIIDDLIKMM